METTNSTKRPGRPVTKGGGIGRTMYTSAQTAGLVNELQTLIERQARDAGIPASISRVDTVDIALREAIERRQGGNTCSS